MCGGIDREREGQRAFLGDPCKQDAHGVRNGQPHTLQYLSGLQLGREGSLPYGAAEHEVDFDLHFEATPANHQFRLTGVSNRHMRLKVPLLQPFGRLPERIRDTGQRLLAGQRPSCACARLRRSSVNRW